MSATSTALSYITVQPDGTYTEIIPDNNSPARYKALSDAVGGLIQWFPISKNHGGIFIHEEGKYEYPSPEDRNAPAQKIAESLGLRLFDGDWLAGPVVFASMGPRGSDGGVTASARAAIIAALGAQ